MKTTLLKKGQRLYIVFAIAIVVIAAVTLTVTAIASGPDTDQTALPPTTATPSDDQAYPPPPDYSPDPVPVPTPTYPSPEITPGTTYSLPLYGPSTRGAAIQIASKTVQLPDNAEVGGFIEHVQVFAIITLGNSTGSTLLIVSDNPDILNRMMAGILLGDPLLVLGETRQVVSEQAPVLIITRANSEVFIGQNTGVVISGRIEPGEESAFDFLKEYFPDQSTTIDSIPALPKPTIPPVNWGFDAPEVTE